MNGLRRRMQRQVAAWVVAAMLLPVISGCATPRAPDSVQLVAIVVGEQRVAGPNERGLLRVTRRGAPIEAWSGMSLAVGDRIETPGNVEAVIRWPSGSEIFMRPNSAGTIGSFTDVVGEVFAKIKGRFAVETTFVTAAARGTAYLVRTGVGGATTVVVVEGQVVIDSPTGAWRALQVGPGTQVTVHPAAPQPMQVSVAELRRTEEWVARLERQVPKPERGLSKAGAAALAIGALIGIILGTQRDDDERKTPSRTDRQHDDRKTPSEQTPARRGY